MFESSFDHLINEMFNEYVDELNHPNPTPEEPELDEYLAQLAEGD